MTPIAIAFAIYAVMLLILSRVTGGKGSNSSFFTADRKAPWPVVAYGMVGASISGVTFISVPGNVFNEEFLYMPMMIGFCIGYVIVAKVLLPLFYKLRVTSIYGYLATRFGERTRRTGSFFFFLSRLLGAGVRIFIVILVLHTGLGWNFSLIALLFILLLLLYTYRGGLKTIIWTDVIQTTLMLVTLISVIVALLNRIDHSELASITGFRMVETDWGSPRNWLKQLLSGIFMTIAMTGLDQGMMQKNLACKDLKSSVRNIYSTSTIIFAVNLFFLFLGYLFTLYVNSLGGLSAIGASSTDQIFPILATGHFGHFITVLFFIGLISATYPSAGAALTSLTTSVCVDFLGFESGSGGLGSKESDSGKRIRGLVQLSISVFLLATVILLYYINDDSVINLIYKLASYTYGPLLGMFAFGIFTRSSVSDKAVPFIAFASPVLCLLLGMLTRSLWGFDLGFSLLIVNGAITFVLMYIAGLFDNKQK